MQKILKIDGMMCSMCSQRVEGALKVLCGGNVTIDLKNGIAQVENSNNVSDSHIKNAIEDLGFDVLEIK